ncbi:hypothetical protein [Piscinibacter koreensis]|uniref:Uncharacterized protein n=1 Tax=Piscinibacter koreensis TaxID=2742824 RepID=A0A7Y6TWD3_9BURK|nr:hypothetical protein [Schlegelella koreensis]NUZ05960.1 hypothetical protein [Schlegelella koreensis]
MKTLRVLSTMLLAALSAFGQAAPTAFPDGATELAGDALTERLAGNTFDVTLANGDTWRLEYRRNGYYFVNASGGFNGSGRWKVDGSRLCSETPRNASCNDVRLAGDRLYLKRDSGEVIALRAR